MKSLITEGLDYFGVSYRPAMLEKLSFFVRDLERWNSRVNLTAKQSVESIVRELLYDTFFLYSVIRVVSSALDMGSGSGILAVPLAILDETMEVISVDRTLKKIQFQRHIRRELDLNNLSLIHGRIESLEPLHVDALAAKGFGPTRLILEKGERHLKYSGTAYLLKGRTEREGTYPGFSPERVIQYRLPKSAKEYQLFVYKKIS